MNSLLLNDDILYYLKGHIYINDYDKMKNVSIKHRDLFNLKPILYNKHYDILLTIRGVSIENIFDIIDLNIRNKYKFKKNKTIKKKLLKYSSLLEICINNKNVFVHDILAKELKKLNIPFKSTSFDNTSFEEQAEFLKDVKILIACHGTAFTNLFLLPKNSTIMEVSFRRYWFCDPVCENHYTGEWAYKSDCHNRNKVINKYSFDEKKRKLIYHKAEYYNLSQLFGIGYKEILIEDANGYFNDNTNTNDINNPINLTNIYIDTNDVINKIRKLF